MPQKVYLDDNGNPITAKVYLDDNGEPIAEKKAPARVESPAPKPFKSESGFRGVEAAADAVRAIPDVLRNLISHPGATLSGAAEGVKGAAKDFAGAISTELGGAKDMAVATAGMVRHPIDTVTGLGGGFVDAAKAIPDIARNTLGSGATAETRKATAKGMGLGVAEGASGVNADQVENDPLRAIGGALALVAGGKVAGAGAKGAKGALLKRAEGARIAAAVKAAETADMARVAEGLGGGVQPEVVARGLAEGPKPVPGAKLVDPNAELLKEVAAAIDEGKAAAHGGVSNSATVSSSMPHQNTAQPPVSYPRVSGRRVVAGERRAAPAPTVPAELVVSEAPAAVGSGPEAPPPGREGHFKLPEPRAKLTDAQFADVDRRINGKFRTDGGPERRGVPTPPAEPKPPAVTVQSRDGQVVKVRPKPGVAADLRRSIGADKAAKKLGVTPEDVRRLAPGPARRPLAAEIADLDAEYTRRINDERGFIDPQAAVKIGVPVAGAVAGGALANDDHKLAGALAGGLGGLALANPKATYHGVIKPARMIGMLSGAALPKSLLGNLGAVINASIDHGTMGPVAELATHPGAVAKDFATGWKAQANTAGRAGLADGSLLSKLNLSGRAMGAMDHATENLLQRGGLSKTAAQDQLLTSPEALTGRLGRELQTELGQYVVPFQRIPVNQVVEGMKALREDLHPGNKSTALKRAATAGSVASGAAASTQTDDPIKMALLAAMFGRRGLPFAVGALGGYTAAKGPSKARSVFERMGTGLPEANFADVVNPTRPITNPAIINWLKFLSGEK